ncbi:Uncharacterised protein [Raoultella terrigena]|uniref:Uncharacterized protein n=1 Tax=Raoultella terrigena TaxID=577 RepID=A0A7Z8ZDE1_RAOTE|nr:Uncharacterised protein [Raoultella terrigena]
MPHLMLSCHGIWFYRKVYLTPWKRRKIRISLRKRSRREALLRVEKYLIVICTTSRLYGLYCLKSGRGW